MQLPATSSQIWQTGHGGSQAHEPQSTNFLQLFLIVPHLPAQVLALGLGLHCRLRLCRPLPRFCDFL